jgi:hypothetical protein
MDTYLACTVHVNPAIQYAHAYATQKETVQRQAAADGKDIRCRWLLEVRPKDTRGSLDRRSGSTLEPHLAQTDLRGSFRSAPLRPLCSFSAVVRAGSFFYHEFFFVARAQDFLGRDVRREGEE